MNREHLKAFLWLRWRLRVNQFRRAGALNAAILMIVAYAAAVLSVVLFFVGFFVGLLALPQAPSWVKLLVWDGIVTAMLFSWMVGLMTELQRSEGLALDKFLHLPVSPVGAFLINYLSSLFSLTLIVFVPGTVGLILGQTFGETPAMLLALPLLAAFLLALTAVTYQFQGWLASLMTNPRKRRTVIVLVTLSFVLVGQLPNAANLLFQRTHVRKTGDSYLKETEERGEITKAFNEKKISLDEHLKRQEEARKKYADEREAQSRESAERMEQIGRLVNAVLPPGWFALGAADLAANSVLPAVLGGLGLTLIGAWSLRRAYRTTLRMYTGAADAGGAKAATPAEQSDPNKVRFLEWRLPWVSEQASAVAVAAFRSLLRAPESKMTLIVPVIILVVFGGIAFTVEEPPPEAARPMISFGAAGMVLLVLVQLAGNQFGFDRAGFRAYVLSPAPRRDILLGRNLALAPIALGLCWLLAAVAECVFPVRVDLFLTVILQTVAMYLLFILLANLLSIYTPMAMAAGAVQPTGVKLMPVLAQMLIMMFYPLLLLPTLAPLGLEVLLAELGVVRGVPVALPLMVLVLAGVVALYRLLLNWEGRLLAAREKTVLAVVTSKVE